ncbi:MAG: biopolymer transporter ExbD [Cytophagales bacterium]|jgi:biopolymer transport protein ExbD|nr:biopolymer transporter ExbD [Bacteroidota bacterium]MBS1982441.1 biopolymer transporter ExbD [Bacteroidota bacterium]WHZ06291.1 MAG: biopolymer transporter ExbD [Cytophagales bacterium]
MKIRRRHKFAAEVATSSLNDIMFFLLLFFLIISTVANPNIIKVLVPKASETQSLNKKTITLTVTKDKDYYINNKPVGKGNLEKDLIAATHGLDEPTVVLYIPRDLEIQDLVDVLKVGVKNKIKIVLATDRK